LKAAFVNSHLRTETFYGISAHLDAECYWISTGDPDWVSFLESKKVPRERILDLAFAYGDEDTDLDAVLEMEKHSAFKASAMIMSDRLLRHKSREKAYSYVSSVYKMIKQFITDNNIDVVFGESTWTAELAASAAAEKCGIPFLTPATTRIPNGRFTFFKGFFQDKLFMEKPVFDSDLEAAEEFYDRFVNHRPVPDYAHIKRDFSLFSGENLRKFKKHLTYMMFHRDKDMTRPDLDYLFDQRIFRRNNAKRLKRLGLSRDISFLKGQKYCVYNLHMQPEASIDVLGSYNSDQFHIIQNIARSLPADAVVVVKEHPQAVGDRVREFYNAVNDLPNAVLVHPESDNWELTAGAFAVVTVSGTAAYQAALLGTPSVVFSDVFFAELPLVYRCRSQEELPDVLKKCMDSDRNTGTAPCTAFLAKLIKNSFEGSVYGREVSDGNVQEANFKAAAKGFNSVLSYIKSENPTVIR
jgi:hypothetical protein